MLFKHFYEPDLAQGSYLIGCQKTGEAVVIDARRDIQAFIDEAAAHNMKIVAVTETHIHADYLSGSRELAEVTGAKLYLSDEGNKDWKYAFKSEKLYDNDEIKIGNIIIKAVHTPGHTPEHISFLLTDGATANEPGYFLTGDFVFVGDVGRPDLLDEAAGGIDTRFVGAKQLFQSLKTKFITLPDYVQIWPGHGAGSSCGKALGAVASTTVGYERKFSWWASFVNNNDEAGFTAALLEGQPDAPLYFGRMKRQNKTGPALLAERRELKHWTSAEVQTQINKDIIFIDTRPSSSYSHDAVIGSLNVPKGKSFATYASYIIDPETESRDIILLASDEQQAKSMRDKLSFVGIDKVTGYLTSVEELERAPVDSIDSKALAELENPYILDIRTANEFNDGHIPNAHQLHAGRVMWKLETLPKDQVIVTHCQSGARNAVLSSALRAAGFDNIVELEGSYLAWLQAQTLTKA